MQNNKESLGSEEWRHPWIGEPDAMHRADGCDLDRKVVLLLKITSVPLSHAS